MALGFEQWCRQNRLSFRSKGMPDLSNATLAEIGQELKRREEQSREELRRLDEIVSQGSQAATAGFQKIDNDRAELDRRLNEVTLYLLKVKAFAEQSYRDAGSPHGDNPEGRERWIGEQIRQS
jgi:hypothetical protein